MVEDITFSFIEVDVNNVTLPNKNVERCWDGVLCVACVDMFNYNHEGQGFVYNGRIQWRRLPICPCRLWYWCGGRHLWGCSPWTEGVTPLPRMQPWQMQNVCWGVVLQNCSTPSPILCSMLVWWRWQWESCWTFQWAGLRWCGLWGSLRFLKGCNLSPQGEPQGDHTPLRFVTTCNNGVFNGGIFMHLSILFHALFVDIKLLWCIF